MLYRGCDRIPFKKLNTKQGIYLGLTLNTFQIPLFKYRGIPMVYPRIPGGYSRYFTNTIEHLEKIVETIEYYKIISQKFGIKQC